MKKIFAMAVVSLMSFSASAYKDGTYNCKNRVEKLPDNVYKIETVNVGGSSLPYVEITLHYYSVVGDNNSPMETSTLRGIATISQTQSKKIENIQLAAMTLSFDGDTFLNCRK